MLIGCMNLRQSRLEKIQAFRWARLSVRFRFLTAWDAVCCRTPSFLAPFNLGGPNSVGILWKRHRVPRSGHLTRTHSHLLT